MAKQHGRAHTNKNGHSFVVESKFIGTRKAVRALLKHRVGSNNIRQIFHTMKNGGKAQ